MDLPTFAFVSLVISMGFWRLHETIKADKRLRDMHSLSEVLTGIALAAKCAQIHQ